MHPTTKHIYKILVLLFLVILITPTIVSITNIEKQKTNSENKKKPSFPKLITLKNPKQFATNINNYYKNNFGLRQTLSDFYIHLKYTKLNESPLPQKVIIGKNDFLFLGNEFNNVIEKSSGFLLFSKKELLNIKESIQEKKDWLKSKNIAFYIAIAPNKHIIYKENLPFKFSKMLTQKEQIIKYIKDEIDFNIIDLGKQFTVKKTENRLYQKLDSHWNELGAFYGYQTLIDEISKDFPIKKMELSDYYIIKDNSNGDINKMINLTSTKDIITLKLKNNIQIDTINYKYYPDLNIDEKRFKNPNKKYKILLFRDSFSTSLIPYLNQTFGECTYIWSYKFDKDIILKEQPDIVILENVERYLDSFKK